MYSEVTLGIRGDLNFLKKKLSESPACRSAVSFSPSEEKDGVHSVCFRAENDLHLLERFLNILAEYILERYEPQLLRRLLRERYAYLSPVQLREVLRGISRFTDHPDVGYAARKRAVLSSLYDYLREDSSMLLDGFAAFRLKEYGTILADLAERLVSDCIAQREYEDFIDLLKYFVSIQEARPPLTHIVIAADGRYELISADGENITDQCMSDFIDCEDIPEDLNFDDLLISMLITLAPERILVHHAEQIRNKELFRTIRLVFDGRLDYCTGCEICAAKPSAAARTQPVKS